LAKLEGSGNDFLVTVDEDYELSDVGASLAARLCQRNLGIGADGLIRLAPLPDGLATEQPVRQFRFELNNADGSRAAISGNGLRCAAHELLRTGWIASGEVVAMHTDAGLRTVQVVSADPTLGSVWVRVEMGRPDVSRAGHSGSEQLFSVDVGNPHLVWIGDRPVPDRTAMEATVAELRARFGDVNYEAVEVTGPSQMDLVVVERGAGWTQACGSGSVAAAAAARSIGSIGDEVRVANPGGILEVSFQGDTAYLAGPSEFIAEIRAPLRFVGSDPASSVVGDEVAGFGPCAGSSASSGASVARVRDTARR
jgi:diaminopimelate epimerase